MYGDEQAFNRWMDSLRGRFGAQHVDDLHAGLITLLARMARRHDQDMVDIQAAKLLPAGADAVAEVLGGCRSAQYKRAARGREKLSTKNSEGRQKSV